MIPINVCNRDESEISSNVRDNIISSNNWGRLNQNGHLVCSGNVLQQALQILISSSIFLFSKPHKRARTDRQCLDVASDIIKIQTSIQKGCRKISSNSASHTEEIPQKSQTGF